MIVLHDNVLVECCEPDSQTTGGLFIPDNCREESNKVRIIGVGSKCKEFKGGEIAFRVKGWGTPIDGTNYYMMKESTLLAKL